MQVIFEVPLPLTSKDSASLITGSICLVSGQKKYLSQALLVYATPLWVDSLIVPDKSM